MNRRRLAPSERISASDRKNRPQAFRARLRDPILFSLWRSAGCWGKHSTGTGQELARAFIPDAREVAIIEGNLALLHLDGADLFEWRGTAGTVPDRYRLVWRDGGHREHVVYDSYSFRPLIPDYDLELFGADRRRHAYRMLGAHAQELDGIAGGRFAIWARNAERISVVGDFYSWEGRRHPMRARGSSGLLCDGVVKDEPCQAAVLDRLLDLLLRSVLKVWFAPRHDQIAASRQDPIRSATRNAATQK